MVSLYFGAQLFYSSKKNYSSQHTIAYLKPKLCGEFYILPSRQKYIACKTAMVCLECCCKRGFGYLNNIFCGFCSENPVKMPSKLSVVKEDALKYSSLSKGSFVENETSEAVFFIMVYICSTAPCWN